MHGQQNIKIHNVIYAYTYGCHCTGGDEARNYSMAWHRDFLHQILLETMKICVTYV